MNLYHIQTPRSLDVVAADSIFDAQVYAIRKESAGKIVPVRIEEVTAEMFDEPTRAYPASCLGHMEFGK